MSIALVSVLSALVLAILPINFTVSALDDATFNGNVVNLPFSSPVSFGNSPAVLMYNELRGRYEYFVFDITRSGTLNNDSVYVKVFFTNPPTGKSSSEYFGGYKFQVGLNVLAVPDGGTNLVEENATVNIYWFTWKPTQTTYTFQRIAEYDLYPQELSATFNPSLATGTYFSYSSFVSYNGVEFTNLNAASKRNYVYVFQGSDGQGVMINQLNQIVGYNQQVVFYLDEILNKLNDGGDYSPEQTTSNADMSNYEQAEGALMDNNIDNLNNLEMPNLDSFNSGSQNNAFKFISSNIEFFSGMNGQGAVSKIATVLFVILGLGLTSFIIGLSNRKKGG